VQKVALVNSTTDSQKKTPRLRETGQTEPCLVAFYDIRPGNVADIYSYNPESTHGAFRSSHDSVVVVMVSKPVIQI